MLARAERVSAEVGTRAERLSSLFPPQGHPIGLAGERAGHGVIGPGLAVIGRRDAELLAPGPLLPVGEGLFDEFFLAEQFQRAVFVGRRGQSQRGLLFQHQRDGGPDMHALRFAGRAIEFEAIAGGGHRGDRGHGILAAGGMGELHAEQVAAEVHVTLSVNFELRALANQLCPLWPQQLAGPHVGQPREPIPQREVFGLFDFRVARAGRGGRHDGDPPMIEGCGGRKSGNA